MILSLSSIFLFFVYSITCVFFFFFWVSLVLYFVCFFMFLFSCFSVFVYFDFHKNKNKKFEKSEKYKNSMCLCILVLVYLGWQLKQSFLNFVSLVTYMSISMHNLTSELCGLCLWQVRLSNLLYLTLISLFLTRRTRKS